MSSLSSNGGKRPLTVLLDPKDSVTWAEKDMRLEDYLNDKIQTRADFGNLASLIASVDQQKEQLENQLRDAKLKLQEAKNSSATYTSTMLEQTREFQRQRDDIHRRIMIITKSDTPEEASRRLQRPMEKLRQAELARSYVNLLNDVDELSKAARKHLPGNPKEALKPYVQLKELTLSLVELQGPAEGAAPHLLQHVQNTVTQLWADMKKIMTDEFESILKNSHWPTDATAPTREWTDCFEKLLDLQTPEILAAQDPVILLPVEVLCRTFVLSFRYHFFGDRETNQIKQLGAYCFQWFTRIVEKWEDYLRDNVNPILATHFKDTQLADNSLYVDAVAAFITALLPVMREKVDSILVEISREPQYLSKFIHELMLFDESIRSRFGYDGGDPEHGWKGLSWNILDTWFDRWSQVEKDFALERYQEVIKAEDSGKLDMDSAGLGKTKTTYGAIKVADLLQSVTKQYNMLRKFSHKVRFLISIQAEILDQYIGRLNDSLERYMSITTTVGRTLHGISKEEAAKLEGLGGIESLCRVYGSADHILSMLKEWVNDEFFIELWEQLQAKAKVTGVDGKLVGQMSYDEVKDCTSDAVGQDGGEGSVFDVTIQNYERVMKRAESLIIQSIKYNMPNWFRPYITKPEWTTVGDLVPNTAMVITAELDQPLQSLRESMLFLRETISQSAFRRIWRDCLDKLQDLLFSEVLLRQTFTTLGAARLNSDVDAIQGTVMNASRGAGSSLTMRRLVDGVNLLGLPLEGAASKMSLREAADAIFETHGQASSVLEGLGIERLTVLEARKILQNRIEAQD